MTGEKACRTCNRLIKSNICPACKTSDTTKSWKGIVVILNPESSAIAKEMVITAPGRYAIRVK